MANQIWPNHNNASDWFRIKSAARGIVIIFIYHEKQLFDNEGPHSIAD